MTTITLQVILNMWQVEYYTKNGGRQPARDWLEGLEKWAKAAVKAKVEKLRQYGLELLNTEMLKPLGGDDADFYGIRAGKHRMATYFDRRRGTFVLLHGFRK